MVFLGFARYQLHGKESVKMAEGIRFNDYRMSYRFKSRSGPGYKNTAVKYSGMPGKESDENAYDSRGGSVVQGKAERDYRYGRNIGTEFNNISRDKSKYRNNTYSENNDNDIYKQKKRKDSYDKDTVTKGSDYRISADRSIADTDDGRVEHDSSGIPNDNNGDGKHYNQNIKYGDMEYISEQEKNGNNDISSAIRISDKDYLHYDKNGDISSDKSLDESGGNIKYYVAKKSIEYAKKIGKNIKDNIDERTDNYGDSYGYSTRNYNRNAPNITGITSTIISGIGAFLVSSSIVPIVFASLTIMMTVISIGAFSVHALNNKTSYSTSGGGFSASVESWRSVVEDRCSYYKDTYKDFDTTDFVNAVLAIIDQESNGISSCCGGDLMQSRESGYWTSGTPEDWDKFSTEKKSIDAGCRYFFSAVTAWGVKDPDDYDGLQIVAQGYNLGTAYLKWMSDQGETKWTNETAEIYSTKMKSQLGVSVYGNPLYGQQWLEKYLKGKTSTYSGDFKALDGTYIFQDESGPCSTCAVADMIKRYCYMMGDTKWDEICPGMMTDEGVSLVNAINDTSYSGGTAGWGCFDSGNAEHYERVDSSWNPLGSGSITIHGIKCEWKVIETSVSKEELISILKEHPEGIAVNGLYYKAGDPNVHGHQKVITRYDADTDEFYCVDPGQWGGSYPGFLSSDAEARKEIPLSSSRCWQSISCINRYRYMVYNHDDTSQDKTEK